ncbi:class I SAM-dependent rRNA methyltransferase, partial [bacterium]|nr:class I SAM-dependent rRNA methyltransferase [bacterium]
HTACRLVNAESDGLPGLIVDRYGPWLVCQILTAGAEVWRDVLVTELAAITGCEGIWERSDVDVRPKEGLSPRTGLMHGVEPPEVVEIHEGAARYLVDIRNGQKTGFYLDQRENRARAAEYAAGAEVLNVFSYTGGFTISALLAGARKVVNVDASAPALEFLDRNVALNEIDPVRVENVGGNAFEVLRRFREEGRRFDLIVVDPPKLVSSRANLQRATRGYKDINLQAFSLLQPGGILFTFSCSGLLDRDLFQKIVADAALDARREARILRYLSQSPDHPISMPFPEGLYLKGLVCQTL